MLTRWLGGSSHPKGMNLTIPRIQRGFKTSTCLKRFKNIYIAIWIQSLKSKVNWTQPIAFSIQLLRTTNRTERATTTTQPFNGLRTFTKCTQDTRIIDISSRRILTIFSIHQITWKLFSFWAFQIWMGTFSTGRNRTFHRPSSPQIIWELLLNSKFSTSSDHKIDLKLTPWSWNPNSTNLLNESYNCINKDTHNKQLL